MADIRLSNYTPLPITQTSGVRAVKPAEQQPAQQTAPASTALQSQPSEILNMLANEEGRGRLVDILV